MNTATTTVKIDVSGVDRRLLLAIYEALEADAADNRFPYKISLIEDHTKAELLIESTDLNVGDARAFLASILRLLRTAYRSVLMVES